VDHNPGNVSDKIFPLTSALGPLMISSNKTESAYNHIGPFCLINCYARIIYNFFTLLKILMAVVFITTGGSVFSEKYRKHRVLAILATIVSIIGAFYLIRSIKEDIIIEAGKSKFTPTREEPNDLMRCEKSYLIINKENSKCGFKLNDLNELEYKGRSINESITVIYENSGTTKSKTIAANMFVVYPQSHSRRFAFIQACQYKEDEKDYGLCWAPYIFDKKKKIIIPTYAGKYGPERWIQWNNDDQYAVLSSANEGAKWLHAIDSNSGKSYSFPLYDSSSIHDAYQIEKIYYETFAWRGPQTFAIQLSTERYDPKSYKVFSKDNVMWEFDITSKGLIGNPRK